MTTYFLLKFLHVIGSTVLLGTGAGIAFFMFMAHRTSDPAAIAHTARIVVIADMLFTATAVVAQPVTGPAPRPASRLAASPRTGSLPRSRSISVHRRLLAPGRLDAGADARSGHRGRRPRAGRCHPAYHRLYRWWFAFGFPAFAAVLAIFWL